VSSITSNENCGISALNWNYIAGFFDGEGCVSIDKANSERAFLVIGVDKYSNGKKFFACHIVGDKALVEEAVLKVAKKIQEEGKETSARREA